MVYLLDSNVIIDSLSAKMPQPALSKLKLIVDDTFAISIISKIEVLGFNSGNQDLDDRSERFIALAKTFELNSEIVQKTISIRKSIKIKLPDAIIASTALVYGLILLTHDIHDFNKVPDLQVMDTYSL